MHISYTQLRAEGLSNRAIETYVIARDAMSSCSAEDVAAFLRVSHKDYPVDVEDVWPAGVPEHWMPDDYDPTDAELEAMWTGPGSHPAHNVAWALHVELHS